MRRRKQALILSILMLLWMTAAPFAVAEAPEVVPQVEAEAMSEAVSQAEATPEPEVPGTEPEESDEAAEPVSDAEEAEVACLPVDETWKDGELELTLPDEEAPIEVELDLSDDEEAAVPEAAIDAESETLVACPTLGMDGDEAISGYIQRQLYAGTQAGSMPLMAAGATAGANLEENSPERRLYDVLRPLIRQVADGELASTVFVVPMRDIYDNVSYSADKLGVDALLEDGKITDAAKTAFNQKVALNLSKVLNALMVDMPYELYWYDKTLGTVYNTLPISYRDDERLYLTKYDTNTLKFSFRVAAEYSVSGETKTFDVDVEKTASIQTAVATARQIVAQYESYSDIGKLYAYKDRICELASYNYDAKSDVSYGNPWQLIWVFDGIEETKVVCEGYAKAFQYLCELSTFSGDVSVVSAFGKMVNELGSGGEHMWDNVTIGGVTYLADITNCDTGCAGYPDQLFLKGYVSRSGNTYTYKTRSRTLSYTYGEKYTALFSAEDLVLSEDITALNFNEYGAVKWQLDSAGHLYIYGSGAIPDSTGESPAPWCADEIRERVAEVYLSEGITRLGDRAFYDCGSLVQISVPDSLTEFGTDVLEGCDKLKSLTLADCTNRRARAYVEAQGLECVLTHGNIVTDAGVAASCTEDGLTEGSHCEACGDVIVAQEVIPATGHSPVVVPAVAPTYSSAGLTEGSRCAVCGTVFVEQQTVAMLTAPKVEPAISAPAAVEHVVVEPVAEAPDYTVHVTKNTSKSVNKGTPMQIVVDGKTVKSYKSSNKKVATVTKTGWVTTKKAGSAKITITLKNKKKLTLKVKVVDPTLAKSVKLLQGKSARVQVGQTLALSAVMTPDTAVSTLKWKSSNKKIATVNQQGVVTAKKAGKVKITVTTGNKKKAVITIRVVK